MVQSVQRQYFLQLLLLAAVMAVPLALLEPLVERVDLAEAQVDWDLLPQVLPHHQDKVTQVVEKPQVTVVQGVAVLEQRGQVLVQAVQEPVVQEVLHTLLGALQLQRGKTYLELTTMLVVVAEVLT
jgi:hypothetical protein